MTHDIDPPDHHVAGESLTQEFTIEEAGAAKDISGATVTWELVPDEGDSRSHAELDDTDSGITVAIVDAAAGRIDVTIDQDVTDGLANRRLWQRLTVDDTGAGKQIWSGYFQIIAP